MTLRTVEFESIPRDLESLREIGRLVGEASGARRVILFGSVARGNTHRDSDLDLLLLFDDDFFSPKPTLFEMAEPGIRARRALRSRRFPKDLVPMRLGHFERGASVLAQVVKEEGVVLYEAAGGRDA